MTLVEQPNEPGAFVGDIWYGHPEKCTLGTHRWDGSAWQELPDEIESCLSLLSSSRARILALEAEIAAMKHDIERLREANGILEDGLQEVGDDYPGSSCQQWCQHQIKQARAALEGTQQ